MTKTVDYFASPTLTRFHASDAFMRGVMGPIGSGKSTGMAWEIFRRAQEQAPGADGKRRTRWAVIRNTYRELADTTVKTWLDWFPEEVLGKFNAGDMVHQISYRDVECEVLFRALDRPKDVKKLLSLELTGAWVHEAREVPRAVIDMLQGRVGRYPSARDGGATWAGVFMDTNPPDTDHWWYRLFEDDRPEGWEHFRQPSGLSPEAENLNWLTQTAETLALPMDHPERLARGRIYYERLQAGKDPEWINVYVHGEYGFLRDGKPVYPEFKDGLHVAAQPLEAIAGQPIYIGVDFGLTPAAIFGQRDVLGRWRWIHELVSEDMGAVRFGKMLAAEIQRLYPGFEIRAFGDPAGDDRAQTDERTPIDILRNAGIPIQPATVNGSKALGNDFTIRREAVATPLSRLIDGVPGLILSPTLKTTRKGMAGGYCYKRVQIAGDERFHDKPDKNRFSHPCEAGQYLMIGGGEGRAVISSGKGSVTGPNVASTTQANGWSVF